MYVIHHAHLSHESVDGELRIPAAGPDRGLNGFSVSVRTLDPGAHTAPQQHDGELVVLALFGGGKLLVDGGPQRFNGPCTLLIPPLQSFQIGNNGSTPLQLVWVYTKVPGPA
jgi:oxalate decarboxylase/phosphoglucose isomerase-like protein (cupin superfamily)